MTLTAVRPLTARSAILSVLLGAHPPESAGSSLVRWGDRLGISEQAVRVALTRMVAAGDLERSDAVYRLSPRLLERQARQDQAIERRPHAWDGSWTIAAVTTVGADAATRADLRQRMTSSRFAELREGVWMRPANLDWVPDADVAASIELMTGAPSRPSIELAAELFDVDGWSQDADALTSALDRSEEPAERIAIAAAIVRLIVADPLLPPELLPADWPGPALRDTYDRFRTSLLGLVAG